MGGLPGGGEGSGSFNIKGSWLWMETKQRCPISSVFPNCVIPELSVQLSKLSSNWLSMQSDFIGSSN